MVTRVNDFCDTGVRESGGVWVGPPAKPRRVQALRRAITDVDAAAAAASVAAVAAAATAAAAAAATAGAGNITTEHV